MPDSVFSVILGAGLIVLGVFFIRRHRSAWKGHQADATLDDREWRHYRAQFRRRVQTSGLLILLGILIPIGDDLFIPWQQFPRIFTLLWMTVLLIVFWVFALGALDWLSTRMHLRVTSATLESVQRKQRELEEEVERLRRMRPMNGSRRHSD